MTWDLNYKIKFSTNYDYLAKAFKIFKANSWSQFHHLNRSRVLKHRILSSMETHQNGLCLCPCLWLVKLAYPTRRWWTRRVRTKLQQPKPVKGHHKFAIFYINEATLQSQKSSRMEKLYAVTVISIDAVESRGHISDEIALYAVSFWPKLNSLFVFLV